MHSVVHRPSDACLRDKGLFVRITIPRFGWLSMRVLGPGDLNRSTEQIS
jgi:hypothetical protein